MKRFSPFFLWIVFIFSACESNPFFGKDKIPNRTISGQVILDKVESYPNGNHDGVFVWVEGLEIKTTTDIDGSFDLILPAANDISSGAITDGEYTIHCFSGNYLISTVNLKFAAGQIVADDRIIDTRGKLKRPIHLNRMLGLNTTVSPEVISQDFDNEVFVKIDLIPDKRDLYVKLKKNQTRGGSIHTGLLIQNSDTEKLAFSIDIDGASIFKEFIARPSKSLEVKFNCPDINISRGTYEIVPYLIIDRDDIPGNLLSAIGYGYDAFNENYFKFPFKRSGGKLVIQ